MGAHVIPVRHLTSFVHSQKLKPTQSSGRQSLTNITENMDDYSLFEGPVGYHASEALDLESSESEDEGWDLNDPDRVCPRLHGLDELILTISAVGPYAR